MRLGFQFSWLIFILVGLCPVLYAEWDDTFFRDDSHNLNNIYYQRLHQKKRDSETGLPIAGEEEKRVRTHQEGILDISAISVAPLRVSVKTGPVQVVGNVELTTRHETTARWVFRAEDLREDQNIWDERGRAVLVPGVVTCQVSHRVSLTDYKQAGLNLVSEGSVPGLEVSLSAGTSSERVRADYVEGEDSCPIGIVSAFTGQREIEAKCKKCLGNVLKTIKQDTQTRIERLSYRLQTPICQKDLECYREDSDWTVGRCVLVKDKNGSHFSECRAKSSIGGACRGSGSRGMFEYTCDEGLACVRVHSAAGFWDYHRYECRDPKNWKFKGPLRGVARSAYTLVQSDLTQIKTLLDNFFKENGKYPSTQESAEFFRKSGQKWTDPFSPFGGSYLYVSADPKHFKILSVGPDRKVNTGDDLTVQK